MGSHWAGLVSVQGFSVVYSAQFVASSWDGLIVSSPKEAKVAWFFWCTHRKPHIMNMNYFSISGCSAQRVLFANCHGPDSLPQVSKRKRPPRTPLMQNVSASSVSSKQTLSQENHIHRLGIFQRLMDPHSNADVEARSSYCPFGWVQLAKTLAYRTSFGWKWRTFHGIGVNFRKVFLNLALKIDATCQLATFEKIT